MTLLGLILAGGMLSKVLTGLLIAVHFLLCLFLIAVVLLQSGRAGDLSSAFGGAPSQANIAAMSSENILTRVTKVCAFGFMATSLLLALFAHGESSSDSVLDAVPEPAAAVAPEEPSGEAGGASAATPPSPAAEAPASGEAAEPVGESAPPASEEAAESADEESGASAEDADQP